MTPSLESASPESASDPLLSPAASLPSPAALTVAVVGAGIIGRNHAAAILRIPSLRIVAVVDPITTAATRLAATIPSEPGCFASLGEALAETKPQVVVICTPSGQHVEQALEALAAGAHVVIEKPLDVSVAQARPLVEAARSAPGQVVSVISQHRFDPATVAVSSAIGAGRFGRLTSAVATVPWWRGQDYYDSAGWRGTLALDGGGALMNQGVHTLDLLLHFLGRPVSVFAYTDRLAHTGIEVEDVLVAVLRFQSGALATLHATTAAFPGSGVRVQLHGSQGSAVVHDDQLESASFAEPGELAEAEPLGTPKPEDNFVVGHLRQYADIVEAILTGRPPGVGVEDAFLALTVVEAIYESAGSGQPVSIDGVTR
ncbi:Gfo/Idh/MocA family oxidoreductase [Actinoplanes sp. NPDC051411]|uniref:Gfo/Idh/MocA family protein n=1 Tax=Actinoplanes sp. NPDC051411 TaxID=3155522 RepID=UPI0034348680